jgi:glyoxylase-like metal-dependent hydrolase (beta-lactamase superfamily II)
MQEIAPHVFIETGFPGVTLGAINWVHGLVLIDAPFRAEDIRSWRATLLNISGGIDRLLVNLDAHFDRTLGSRAMECTVVGHDKLTHIFRNRPVTFKSQSAERGEEWEQFNGLGSIRWAPPEITFTEVLNIYWDDAPVVLVSKPGPAIGAIWAVLPEEHIVFIGDTVVKNQPPFLASADLPAWIESLKTLLSPSYQDFLLVCGRGGLVVHREARQMLDQLERIHENFEKLAANQASIEEVEKMALELLKAVDYPSQMKMLFRQRLQWGLRQYYLRHYHPSSAENLDE